MGQWVRVYGRGIGTVGRGVEDDPKIESMERDRCSSSANPVL